MKQECNSRELLTKPCSALELTNTLKEAAARYEQLKRERQLLEGTLSGAVKVLTDIIRMIDPLGFEESQLIRKDVRELAYRVGVKEAWEVELAAMLFNLGSLVLPTPVLVKFRTDQQFSLEEKRAAARVPEVGAKLLEQVPRLEGVAAIIKKQNERPAADTVLQTDTEIGSELLRILREVARLKTRGLSLKECLNALAEADPLFDQKILRIVLAYYEAIEERPTEGQARRVAVEDLLPGNRVAADINTRDGVVLVKAGALLDEMLIERVRNYSAFVGLCSPPLVVGS